jgi:hypothetical protein
VQVARDDEELPEDLEESDDFLEIPHFNDLLEQDLVRGFTAAEIPEREAEVRSFFCGPGGYRLYKRLLQELGSARSLARVRRQASPRDRDRMVRGERSRSGQRVRIRQGRPGPAATALLLGCRRDRLLDSDGEARAMATAVESKEDVLTRSRDRDPSRW